MADNIEISEATQFLEVVLQMHSPLASLAKDRVGFLRDIIPAFVSKIPFQSVTAIATPKPERRGLTFREIKADMMTRKGGLCFELNRFMKVLLETLGFEVHHVGCNVLGKPNNHLTTVVKDLIRPGDLHLVDVGSGQVLPTFEPIPLDFDKESPLYKARNMVHRFTKDSEGSFRWMQMSHLKLNSLPEFVVGEWYTFMEFNLEFRDDFEFFAPSVEIIHTVESGPEALSIFLVRLKAADYRNGRLFAITDKTILEEDASGNVNKKRTSSPQELLEAFRTHFPQFPEEVVQRAIQTLALKFEKVPTPE